MVMDATRWTQARELFRQALELPAGDREAFLQHACGDDREMRDEIASLLEADQEAGSFLAGPAAVSTGDDQEETRVLDEGDLSPGYSIGPYKVVHKLAEGGMGTVYLAVRDDAAFQKRVAVKVLKPGMDSTEIVRRFRTERQILAALDHPNIARLLDGGTTERGLPYFVMEYIEGLPIDEYCASHDLPIRERLRLFREVCAAVQFAHQNLIVHRDLKPSNILITADGAPKLLDFGIAKLLNPELTSQTVAPTAIALRLMTLEYASPEQIQGTTISTSSDIYSLGVLLYLLLTGLQPYATRSDSPLVMARIVCEEQPLKPSTAVSKRLAPQKKLPARSRRRLAGDLDNIVLMALRKEPHRRYASVQQFSDDIERHLQGMPVMARRATWPYRCAKFIRRHRLGLAVTAALFVASLAFGLMMARQRDQIARERDRAEGVTEFLLDLFEGSDPHLSRGRAVTARELLDRGAARLASGLSAGGASRFALNEAVGVIYLRLGDFERAEEHLEAALDQARQELGEEHVKIVGILTQLGALRREEGKLAESGRLLEEALEMGRRLLGEEAPEIVKTLNELASLALLKGDFDGAEALFTEVLTRRRQLYGEHHADVAEALDNLGTVAFNRGDLTRAELFYQQAFDLYQQLGVEQHPWAAINLTNLATTKQYAGEHTEARRLYQRALELHRQLLGNEHPTVATTLNNLAAVAHREGDLEEAEKLFRESLTLRRAVLGDDHPDVAESLNNLGVVMRIRGETEAAQALLDEALALWRKLLGPEHPNLANTLFHLASLHLTQKEVATCEEQAREAHEILSRAAGDHPRLATVGGVLGECLMFLGKYDEAEPYLLDSYERAERQGGAEEEETRAARARLAALYEAWGKDGEAARYRVVL